jgi:hypothetical protein
LSLFFTYTLLVNVGRNPTIGMTEHLLRRFDVDSFLSQHGSQPVPEAVPPDPFIDPDPLQRRSKYYV